MVESGESTGMVGIDLRMESGLTRAVFKTRTR